MTFSRSFLVMALLAAMAGICASCAASPGTADLPRQTALEFCRTYFEEANPAAALPLTRAGARAALEEEVRLLEGQSPPATPVASTRLETREEYENGQLIKFGVQVSVPPDPTSARGTPPSRFSFDLFLRHQPQGSLPAWQVIRFTRR